MKIRRASVKLVRWLVCKSLLLIFLQRAECVFQVSGCGTHTTTTTTKDCLAKHNKHIQWSWQRTWESTETAKKNKKNRGSDWPADFISSLMVEPRKVGDQRAHLSVDCWNHWSHNTAWLWREKNTFLYEGITQSFRISGTFPLINPVSMRKGCAVSRVCVRVFAI